MIDPTRALTVYAVLIDQRRKAANALMDHGERSRELTDAYTSADRAVDEARKAIYRMAAEGLTEQWVTRDDPGCYECSVAA